MSTVFTYSMPTLTMTTAIRSLAQTHHGASHDPDNPTWACVRVPHFVDYRHQYMRKRLGMDVYNMCLMNYNEMFHCNSRDPRGHRQYDNRMNIPLSPRLLFYYTSMLGPETVCVFTGASRKVQTSQQNKTCECQLSLQAGRL